MRRKKFRYSEATLQKLVEEATVDCYGEDEEFTGIVVTLQDKLPFPFEAKVIGESVEVIEIAESRSELRRGIITKVRKGGKEYHAALSELELSENFKGLKHWEMYEYWLGGFE